MAGKIRVGIVGATVTPGGSGWGAQAHVPALHALPDFELKAVCTSRESTAKASAEAFGAELAFHDFDQMAAHPAIDLISVVVRVPQHRDLVLAGLRAGKPVYCEWPLGADLAQAREMAALARERRVPTMVGLQGRSDPVVRYARDLVGQGFVGEVLAANLVVAGEAVLERGAGRIWQGIRANGANPLTIAGGHNIDVLCFVLGELEEVSARITTRITEWRHTETGATATVDAPDTVNLVGRLVTGAEVAVQVTTVPWSPRGARLEIYGREGALFLTGALNRGPKLQGARGKEPLAEMAAPDRYSLVPPGTAAGPHRNVAEAYMRFAAALRARAAVDPDFDAAVTRHELIAALERSSSAGASTTPVGARTA